MGSINEKAVEKLKIEFNVMKKLTRRAEVVAEPVLNALCEFCNQSEIFSQSVVQTGRKLKDCIEDSVKDAEGAISDVEVYRRAAAFYYDGATINVTMTINLGGENKHEEAPTPNQNKGLSLSLDDLL